MRDERDAERRAAAGMLMTTSSAPAGPAIGLARGRLAASNAQPVDDLAADDVRVDDLVDVVAVDVRVPDPSG